jgi:hypothetical protein
MEPDRTHSPNPRTQALLWNLPIDAATMEVVAALQARGIDSVVLKGPALTDWYPENSNRVYSDGDVWIAPDHAPGAEAILRTLGFEPIRDEEEPPDWWAGWTEHAHDWRREADGVNIDLHVQLQGTTQDPALTWAALWPRCVQFTLAGKQAVRLPEDARALYVTLHATQHGVARGASMNHLTAALGALDDTTWRSALQLARDLGAVEGFATGLRLVPAGAELAARIEVPEARDVRSTLLASNAPPVALGFNQLSEARGLRRVELLFRKFVPTPGFIRDWWMPAAQSRRMLMLGYLYRPVWLLRHAPAGYRAWRAAHRDSSSSS